MNKLLAHITKISIYFQLRNFFLNCTLYHQAQLKKKEQVQHTYGNEYTYLPKRIRVLTETSTRTYRNEYAYLLKRIRVLTETSTRTYRNEYAYLPKRIRVLTETNTRTY